MNEEQQKVLIVDDIPENIGVLMDYLNEKGFKTLVAEDGESAIEQIEYVKPDIILLDVMMPGMNGFETCKVLKENEDTKDIPVIFLTALSDTVDKVKGFEVGGVDYITKPIKQEEVLARVRTHLRLRELELELKKQNDLLEKKVDQRTKDLKKTLEEVEELKNKLHAENIYLKQELISTYTFDEIITNNRKMKQMLSQIEMVAKTDSTVLIYGETGTGKELVAKAVHKRSLRANKPIIKVNCASLPANLIESELFGHEKGAFTGAISKKIGRFELADGGTLFLDEIGDLPLELQAKLLRVLQEGEFERLGNSKTIKVNVRVISATNVDLNKAIDEGKFREDLFYRLNVFPLELPALRKRQDDIKLLVNHFVSKYSSRMGKYIEKIPSRVIEELETYDWPGNVRELENVIERAVIVSPEDTLLLNSTPFMRKREKADNKNKTLKDIEREHILEALIDSNWIIEGKRGAAKKVDLPPSTLRDRMKKLNIQRPD